MKQLLSLIEASSRLGIHVATLRSWIREGKVPAYRLGQRFTRVSWDEVLSALDQAKAAKSPLVDACDTSSGNSASQSDEQGHDAEVATTSEK